MVGTIMMLIKRGTSPWCCNMSTRTKSYVVALDLREKVDAQDADHKEDRGSVLCKAWDRDIMIGKG